jgi:predicted PurR-regulated permease PerM
VVVPVFVGAAVGVSQGVRYASKLSTNIDTLVKSIDAPDNPSYRAALPSETWRKIRDELVDQEKSRLRGALKDASDAARDALKSAIPGLKPDPKKSEPTKSEPAKSEPAKSEPAQPDPTKPDAVGQTSAGPNVTASGDSGERNEVGTPEQVAIPSATAPQDTSPIYEGVRWSVNWLRSNAGSIGQQALTSGIVAVGSVTTAVTGFGVLLFQAFLTAFFFFSFSTAWPKVLAFGQSLLPVENKKAIVSLIEKMDRAIAAFIRGRLTICAILTVHYSVGYFLIGVPAPFLLGPIVAILALFPYISGIGVPIAILLLYLEPHTGIRAEWWWVVFAPVVVFLTAQALDDYVLTPTIQGKHTDMNVAMILFASISGGLLGGFYGLLLAIPAAACIRILIIEVVLPRIKAWSEGRAQDLLPIGSSSGEKK